MKKYLSVCVFAAIDRPLTYCAEDSEGPCSGRRVAVPLGKKSTTGLVISESAHPPAGIEPARIRKIIKVIDETPVINRELIMLGSWVSSYYCAAPGMVFATVLSALKKVKPKKRAELTGKACATNPVEQEILSYLGSRRGKKAFFGDITEACGSRDTYKALEELEKNGAIKVTDIVNMAKSPASSGLHFPKFAKKEFSLTGEQELALNKISRALDSRLFAPFLLLGVTGSGKTEVYVRAAKKCVENGRNVIMLVPEIFLTPQTVGRFLQEFPDQAAVLHSGLSDNERAAQWELIRNNGVKIAIGTRSAVFAPFDNIGLIIVDEEFDTSYKQDNEPRYSGRDTAVYRAKLNNAAVILGSATPSIETWHNAKTGKYTLLKLAERANKKPLPQIKVVDMKLDWNGGMDLFLSDTLAAGLRQTMDEGGQAVIFINRRGFASFVHCARCGHVEKCPDCGIPLVYHKKTNEMICHYCNFGKAPPVMCENCGKPVFYSGVGTQRVEEVLSKFFPDKVIKRIDLDSASGFEDYTGIYEDIRDKKIDIVVGTQMIAKGFDFPEVSFAGVVGIDSVLNLPDFRSEERVYQLLTQVAGRAGRADKAGRVVIQTFNPDAEGIKRAVNYDTEGFYDSQLKLRRMLNYPPFCRILQAVIRHKDSDKAFEQAERVRKAAQSAVKKDEAEILGPSEAPLAMLKGRHRVSIIIKAKKASILSACAEAMKKEAKGMELTINIDPLNIL